jgi:hypothetical protein
MLTEPHIFPQALPPGYSELSEEPEFDPETDLALEPPESLTSLRQLGYAAGVEDYYGSELGISAPFHILSDTGLAKLRTVIEALRPFTVQDPGNPRVHGTLRGAAYRSRFIRALSLSPEISNFLGGLARMDMVPSAYPHQLAHFNFPPEDITEPISGWHFDSYSFVMVMVVHDPTDLAGGAFQYFPGTRTEGVALIKESGTIPDGRYAAPDFPAGGYAILMQGSAIVHRAEPLLSPGNRITMVTSYQPTDVHYRDFTRVDLDTGEEAQNDLNVQLELACRHVDYARHKVWRVRGKLDDFLNEIEWSDDRPRVIARLESALREANELIEALGGSAEHAEDPDHDTSDLA